MFDFVFRMVILILCFISVSFSDVEEPKFEKIKTEEESFYNASTIDVSTTSKDKQVELDNYLSRYDKIGFPKKQEKYYKYNPKPLGRKNNRNFIPEEKKTEEYWQKRIKNNIAARNSREERRRKELETLEKKAAYEKENLELRLFIQKIETENQYLLYEISLLRENKNY